MNSCLAGGRLLNLTRSYKLLRPLCSPLSAMSKPHTHLASQLSRQQHSRPSPQLQFPSLPPELRDVYKKGQMYKYADQLPKLPVPPLHQTLHKYITSVEPLLTEEELAETKRKVEEFGKPGGIGEWLQSKLQERAQSKENWLAEWWLKVAYLGYRLPVPVNVSPAICYHPQPAGDMDTYLRTATSHLLLAIKWILIVNNDAIPPDVYRNKPMCMSQFPLFQKTRIPCRGVDRTQQTPLHLARHVLVVRNGNFFKLDILYEAPNGELSVAPADHILQQLQHIVEGGASPAPHPVGILTTQHRDTWAEARERLIADLVNRQSLEVVETAMLTLCLDRAHPQSAGPHVPLQDSHSAVVAKRCLHGNGTRQNSCNRWFDSAVQLVIGEDGGCGSILEHSAGDGPAAIILNIFCNDMLHSLKYDVFSEVSPVERRALQPAQQLDWNISTSTTTDIESAKNNMDKLVQDTDVVCLTFSDFGKDFSKAVKISPDGFIQIAIQLAYHKLYGRPTAMYESGGTRWFKFGRTDTIRSTTNASAAFLKAMADPSISVEEKANLLVEAVQAHSKYTEDAISGQAVDRHLLGLKLIADENELEIPDLFTDVAYTRSLHFCLSTSQVPVANHRMFLCFGAVVEDGYGVCYNPREKEILFTVTSWHSCSQTDSLRMASSLKESLLQMRELMVQAGRVRSKL